MTKTQQLIDAVLLAHPEDDRMRAMALEAREELAEPREGEVVEGEKLWLWKNGDHFLAFRHLYPCFEPDGDPMTLGEPVGYAIFKKSHNRQGKA